MPFTEIEKLVLEAIRLEAPDPFDLKRAAILIAEIYGWSVPKEQDLQQTIESLYHSGILQIIDADFLEEKKAELERKQIYGPVFDWPQIGSYDLSPAGYECVRQKRQQFWENRPRYMLEVTSKLVAEHFQYFSPSCRLLIRWKRELEKCPGVTILDEPKPCAAWQLSFQETLCRGFQLDVIQSASEGNAVVPTMQDELMSAIQARYMICHRAVQQQFGMNSVAEIFLLVICSGLFGNQAMVYPTVQLDFLVDACRGELSVPADRIMNHAIHRGWLNELDPVTCDAYRRARSDPAHCINLMESPRPIEEIQCLTILGFSVLYEVLNLIWGNDGWKAYLLGKRTVSDLSYHYYSEYDAAEQAIDMLSRKSETVTAGPIEELGRWCTHWYEVGEQGYRVAFRTFYE